MGVAYSPTESTPPCLVLSLIGIPLGGRTWFGFGPWGCYWVFWRCSGFCLLRHFFLGHTGLRLAKPCHMPFVHLGILHTLLGFCGLFLLLFVLNGPRWNCPVCRQLGHSWLLVLFFFYNFFLVVFCSTFFFKHIFGCLFSFPALVIQGDFSFCTLSVLIFCLPMVCFSRLRTISSISEYSLLWI